MNAHNATSQSHPFFEGANEISKNLDKGSNFLKKSVWEMKTGKTEEM